MRKVPTNVVVADPTKITIMRQEFIGVCRLFIHCYTLIMQNLPMVPTGKSEKEDFLRNIWIEYAEEYKFDYCLEYLLFEPEVGSLNDKCETKGRIDIKVTGTQAVSYADRNIYFSFECKRLSGIQKNNDYIHEEKGMGRYVIQEKYSKGLPWGGMIGFVEKGDIDKIQKNLATRLEKHCEPLLRSNLNMTVLDPSFKYSYVSNHVRKVSRDSIELWHLLFDVVRLYSKAK